ncbi:YbjN domain-containing protein [Streptomyces sp. NPDC059985]|uniref:YbjN domain-containing protein n=1 Tax=Streptomyces sp. NPDC059985 TaxID=3347025 RepID=UPI0036CA5109
MSTDPASIPNFWTPPAPPSAQPGSPPSLIPDAGLVRELLDQMELKHFLDDDGDVAVPWEHFRMYFTIQGEGQDRCFSLRTFYDRLPSADTRTDLREIIDDWNSRTLWPKVYTVGDDEGPVHLIGETQMLIGSGVFLEHFTFSMASWIQASIDFYDWLSGHSRHASTAVECADDS